jgi:ribosomal protein S18 acetylase RimI-like enzyme
MYEIVEIESDNIRAYEIALAMDLQLFGQQVGGYESISDMHSSVLFMVLDKEDNNAFVGYAVLKADGQRAVLDRVGIMPNARGNGLQSRLIAVREQKAAAMGYKVIYTYTTPNNPYSMNNLIWSGYVTYNPDHYDETHSGEFVFFKKSLEKSGRQELASGVRRN